MMMPLPLLLAWTCLMRNASIQILRPVLLLMLLLRRFAAA